MAQHIEHLPADVFGLSALARAALSGRPRPASLEGILVPGRAQDLARPNDHLEKEERSALCAALSDALAPLEPHVAVLDSLRALERPGTFLVLAGQQPGFLGGPLFNVYKALHAVRLARELSAAWKVPVVPGFWNHADDHDVAEIHHLFLQDEALGLRRVALPGLSSGRTPFGSILMDEERNQLSGLRALLGELLAAAPRRDEALELFLPRPGESLSGTFTRMLLALFGHLGLVVVDPGHVRASLSAALARIVSGGILEGLAEGAARLERAGHEPAIPPAGAALVYRIDPDRGKVALRPAPEGGLKLDGEAGSRTESELASEILQEPERYSPGALLRPLVQDRALPVAAYVGGWGELAYLAQLPTVRRHLSVPCPAFVPRLSATLVEPAVRASAEKLGLAPAAALAEETLAAHEAADEPPAHAGAVRSIGSEAAEALLALRADLVDLDPSLLGPLKKTAAHVRGGTEKLAAKIERVHQNREGSARRHARRLRSALRPRGLPQERVRGAVELVALLGRSWIDELLTEIDPFPTEHALVFLEEAAGPPQERGSSA